MMSIEVICWAGLVYCFCLLAAQMVGELAPTIIVENQIKMMSVEVICRAGRVYLFYQLMVHMVGETRSYGIFWQHDRLFSSY